MNNEIQKFDFKGAALHTQRRRVMEDDTTFAALAEVLKPMNTTKDIADRCGIKESTLAYWRGAGIGPKFVKVGRTVMYPKEPMIAYFKEHLYQSTCEYEGKESA